MEEEAIETFKEEHYPSPAVGGKSTEIYLGEEVIKDLKKEK